MLWIIYLVGVVLFILFGNAKINGKPSFPFKVVTSFLWPLWLFFMVFVFILAILTMLIVAITGHGQFTWRGRVVHTGRKSR